MFGGAFGWPHLLVIVAVLLLLFGATKLPALARGLGQSARVFKSEMRAMKDEVGDEVAPSVEPVSPAGSPQPLVAPAKATSADA
jgi:sec-independent protein translocase protein TatA